MSEYTATVSWKRNDENFIDNQYSRVHDWKFDGGITVKASASPHVIKPPMSDTAAIDPEEAFVASLSSCHMLWFLAIAVKRGYIIDSYTDEAVGYLEKNDEGAFAMTRVILRPSVTCTGEKIPDSDTLNSMHHEAHLKCFIANSVRTKVTFQQQPPPE